MARSRPQQIDLDHTSDGEEARGRVASLVDQSRAVVDQLPAFADGAREALDGAREAVEGAQGRLDDLSDTGVIATSGFALGLNVGLLVAGAPRVIVAASAGFVLLALRSAMRRGLRPDRLVN